MPRNLGPQFEGMGDEPEPIHEYTEREKADRARDLAMRNWGIVKELHARGEDIPLHYLVDPHPNNPPFYGHHTYMDDYEELVGLRDPENPDHWLGGGFYKEEQ